MKYFKIFVGLFIFFSFIYPCFAEITYCVSILPCPVLNTPDFKEVFGAEDGKSIKLDHKGFIRELEFIAFKGTLFKVISQDQKSYYRILQVETSDYPSEKPIYIDSRFVDCKKENLSDRKPHLVPVEEIISFLKNMQGKPYMWGGNYYKGIDQMLKFYPPSDILSPEILSIWRLEGLDCSGLIYQASSGYTPRNTSFMLNYGQGLKISDLSVGEISAKLKPLDLIVWPGHVVIVLDLDTVIESSYPDGVIKSDLTTRLKSIMSNRNPVDKWQEDLVESFVIRRWHNSFK